MSPRLTSRGTLGLMADQFDTIVIGAAGAMGSAACYHLAKRGRRVLGLDQFQIAHDRGSSHGLSRMIRMSYYEHPDYVPLLKRAYELWRELETESGERLLFTPGGVYMGREDSDAVAGSRRAAVEHGLTHEMLTRRQLAGRFPQFNVPDDFVALCEPVAGWLAPERVIAAHARLAFASSATIRTSERVESWEADASGVRVRTSTAEYRAQSLVIAAGVWSNRVISDLGVAITPTRQVLGWFSPVDAAPFKKPDAPVWAMQTPANSEGGGDLFYGFPASRNGPGEGPTIKVARHAQGTPIDPDRDGREARPGDENDIRPFLRRFMPMADGPLTDLRICMYENSPDSHFIIDHHPAHANVIVAGGFSGHGFKFASVVGEVLADLASCGETRHPIEFLGLRRFAHPT